MGVVSYYAFETVCFQNEVGSLSGIMLILYCVCSAMLAAIAVMTAEGLHVVDGCQGGEHLACIFSWSMLQWDVEMFGHKLVGEFLHSVKLEQHQAKGATHTRITTTKNCPASRTVQLCPACSSFFHYALSFLPFFICHLAFQLHWIGLSCGPEQTFKVEYS